MDNKTKEIWDEYIKTRDIGLRNILVERYINIVHKVARRINIPYVDYDDIVGYGFLGLIDAVERFDPNRNTLFTTYAPLRIRGMIIDKIRANDWSGRTLRYKERKIEKIKEYLLSKGIEDTAENIAKELDMDIDKYNKLTHDIFLSHMCYIEEITDESGELLVDIPNGSISPEILIENKETTEDIEKSLMKLTPHERKILYGYYYEGYTKTKIAKIIGLSLARVCQLHDRAITKMKRLLKNKNIGMINDR